jgi:hypothetical protein
VEDNGEGQYKLIIKEVWDIDGGDYTCEVSAPGGMNGKGNGAHQNAKKNTIFCNIIK